MKILVLILVISITDSLINPICGSYLSSANCGLSHLNNSLDENNINTYDANADEFPWMASLQLDGNHFCGGSIINRRWILTASHCIKEIKLSEDMPKFRVIVGTVNRTNRRMSFGVEKLIINSCHVKHGVGFGDIGLIKTDKDIEFMQINNRYVVNDICLPKRDSEPIGYKVILSGWGLMDDDNGLPTILKKTAMKLSSLQKCQINLIFRLIGMQSVSNDNLCVQSGKSTPCNGDSGGPLIQYINNQWHVIGIVAFGFKGCEFSDPTFYTKVSKYINWIENSISYSRRVNDKVIIHYMN